MKPFFFAALFCAFSFSSLCSAIYHHVIDAARAPSTSSTNRDSHIGSFANASAPDSLLAKQPLSVGDRGDAVGKEKEDNDKGKQLTFESRSVYTWEVAQLDAPFNELIISWNSSRPETGAYLIEVSLLQEAGWSPWLRYARWGAEDQTSFSYTQGKIQVDQDVISADGHGFKVRVTSQEGARLRKLRSLHVATAPLPATPSRYPSPSRINLACQGLSQMALQDERKERLCSPTSTLAVLHFLNYATHLGPLEFATNCWDRGFDIFGNWVFNIAAASSMIETGHLTCWVERLTGIEQICTSLHKGFPVVVSVKGPLAGSATPYANGHLLVVTGYDPIKKEVVCMDPAFPTDETTHVRYALDDFLAAWKRRQNIAYLFDHTQTICNSL